MSYKVPSKKALCAEIAVSMDRALESRGGLAPSSRTAVAALIEVMAEQLHALHQQFADLANPVVKIKASDYQARTYEPLFQGRYLPPLLDEKKIRKLADAKPGDQVSVTLNAAGSGLPPMTIEPVKRSERKLDPYGNPIVPWGEE